MLAPRPRSLARRRNRPLRLLPFLLCLTLATACSGSQSDEEFDETLGGANIDGGGADGGPDNPGGTPQLTVSFEGDGSGQVTSTPTGIQCGAQCSAAFTLDSVVHLMATPDESSEFAGWGDPCSGSESSCELDFEGDTQVTARFLLKRHAVSVNYGGDGSGEVEIALLEGPACAGEPCTYATGSRLQLTAKASADSQFSGWNGVPCGIESVCELVITGEYNIEALFGKQERGLALVLEGSGKGRVHSEPVAIDCPGTCAAGWTIGTAVQLTAEPDAESSRFVGWTSACTGEALTCAITLDESKEVRASFALLTRPLDVSVGGNGGGRVIAKVVKDDGDGDDEEEVQDIIRCGQGETDCEELLDHGTKVELTLAPAVGSGFSWGGACAGQETVTCTLSMTEARDVRADFLLQPRTLTVALAGNGAGRVTGLVSGSQTVISCGDGGADCLETVNHGTSVTLTAAPAASSTFSGWGGACSGTAACTVSLTEARNVSASFALKSYAVSVSKAGNGSGTVSGPGIDCGADCSQPFTHGASVTLTAAPGSNSNFVGFSGACTGTTTCTVSVTEARNVTANFTLKVYPLSVTKTGNGNGTVSGTNIACGADCGESFNHGTSVALSATPAADSVFTGWSGACSGTAGCTVSMVQARDVTANFALRTYSLSVAKTGTGSGTVSGSGVSCGTDCSETFNHGTDVSLTATADASSTFTGWSGACTGTGGCTVDMTAVREVTATFALLTPTLSVSKGGNGSGTVQGPDINCGNDCGQSYNYDTDVTLTASADPSSSFAGWTGACSGTGTCTVDMTQARSVGATFTLRTYPLTVTKAGNGQGSVTGGGINCGSECSRTFNHGTDVILTAAVTGDSAFAGWSGACSGTGTCTVAMTQIRNVTATFTLNSYALSVTRAGSGQGSVTGGAIHCGATCSATFNSATDVTLTASPDASSTFTGWSGACTGSAATCTVSMTQTRAVTATFAIRTFALTVNKTGTGAGTVSGDGINCGSDCSENYSYDTNVTLVAAADTSSTFAGWSGACTGTEACVVNMRQVRSVTASFTLRAPTLSVSSAGTGTGVVTGPNINCGADCSENYPYGTNVTLTAAANASSTFAGWSGACSGTADCTVSMTQARFVTANFDLRTPTLVITKPGTGSGTVQGSGIDCGSDCSENYSYGTGVGLTATADPSSTFTGWGGACSGVGSCTVDMTQGRSVSATFTLRVLRLAVSKGGSGTGTVTGGGINCGATCGAELNYGTSVTLTAAPDASSTFTGWSGACTGMGACTVGMTQARSVVATFTRRTPALSVSKIGTGTGVVSTSPAGVNCGPTCAANFDYDTNVTLTAAADASSTFGGWSGACSGAGACVVGMTQARSVTATFTARTPALTVTRTGSGGGSVTGPNIACPSDCSETYAYDADITLTATPDASSDFTGWSGACTGTGTCTVDMKTAQTVNANFDTKSHRLVVRTSGGNDYMVNGAGIACGTAGTDCDEVFTHNAVVELSVALGRDTDFVGWGGACSGTGTCRVTMNQARNVTAAFALKTFALNVTTTGNGTVASNPAGITCGSTCSATYNFGTSVTLTATPGTGSAFTGWGGGVCTGTGTCVVSMTQVRNVTASFAVRNYTLTVNRTGTGTGTITGSGVNCNAATCTYSFPYNTVLSLRAAPAASSTFSGWAGGVCTGTGTCSVTMSTNRTVSAGFTIRTQRLVVRVGSVDSDAGILVTAPGYANRECRFTWPSQAVSCAYTFNYGTQVTLTYQLYGGTQFSRWSGSTCTGTGRTCVFTMNQDHDQTGSFWILL